MSATVDGALSWPARQRPTTSEPLSGSRRGGDWPHTKRALPWMLTGFLAMVWLVPFDATAVPVTLPVDSQLDRFLLAALALACAVAALGARELGPRRVHSPLNTAVVAFLAVASISVVLNLTVLARLDELDLAVKKLALAFSFAAFFWIAASTIRRAEIRAFITLTIVLASITAAGTIIEYRSGTNHFYDLAGTLIPAVTIGPEPVDPTFGRPSVTGPTGHGLAVTAMLAMTLPLAVLRMSEARETRARILYAIAVGLILAGGVATLRKTGVVAPAVALLVLTLYRPRAMVRLLPLGLVLVLAIQLLAPGALSGVRYELTGGSALSNQARTSDYAAVAPDIAAHPVLGRGYGTYDPRIHLRADDPQRHRVLDNEYLTLLIEVGIVGLVVYLALAATAVISLHPTTRSRDPARAGAALAVIAGVAAYAVSNFLFDTLAFPQVPYLFFFLLGMGAVARHAPEGSARHARRLGTPG